MHETGTAKQSARSTRLHTAIETSLDPTYMDRTEISLRADFLLPWADIPQSALGSAKSHHPPKCGTQWCRLQTVSARSLGHCAWVCITDILSPRTPEAMDMILAILGYVTNRPKLWLCKEIPSWQRRKILKIYIMTQLLVTKYSLPDFGWLLLSSGVAESGKNAKCCAWPPFIRLVGLIYYPL